eukprot:m.96144 g.96144  ORF g.96144 m.96144 type:complete len:579 (-) comp13924_c0_seq4:69-1805(-)
MAAAHLSRTNTPRALGIAEKTSPTRESVVQGAAARAIAVFLDNEVWFAGLTERLLGFLTPDRCSTVLSDADYAVVLRPFAGIHAAVTTLAQLGAVAQDVNSFVNALAAQASLVSDMMLGFAEQVPRARSVLESAAARDPPAMTFLWDQAKRQGGQLPSSTVLLFEICGEHAFSYPSRIQEICQAVTAEASADPDGSHAACVALVTELVAAMDVAAQQAHHTQAYARLQALATTLVRTLRIPPTSGKERDTRAARVAALLDVPLMNEFLLRAGKGRNATRVCLFRDRLMVTQIKEGEEESLLAGPCPFASVTAQNLGEKGLEIVSEGTSVVLPPSRDVMAALEAAGVTMRRELPQRTGSIASLLRSRTRDSLSLPLSPAAAGPSSPSLEGGNRSPTLNPAPPARGLSSVSLSIKDQIAALQVNESPMRPRAPCDISPEDILASSQRFSEMALQAPLRRTCSRASLMPVEKQLPLVLESLKVTRRWAEGLEDMLSGTSRRLIGERQPSLKSVHAMVRHAEEEDMHLSRLFAEIPSTAPQDAFTFERTVSQLSVLRQSRPASSTNVFSRTKSQEAWAGPAI